MNKYKNIYFRVNSDSYFEIRTGRAKFRYSEYADLVKIVFYKNKKEYFNVLRNDTLFTVLSSFKQTASDLVENKLIVSPEENLEEGIAYRQSFLDHTLPIKSVEDIKSTNKWMRYCIFSSLYNKTVWLYEYKSNFYLEISPLYSVYPNNTKEKYNSFIKNYRPNFIEKISFCSIKEWYKNSSFMLQILDENNVRTHLDDK